MSKKSNDPKLLGKLTGSKHATTAQQAASRSTGAPATGAQVQGPPAGNAQAPSGTTSNVLSSSNPDVLFQQGQDLMKNFNNSGDANILQKALDCLDRAVKLTPKNETAAKRLPRIAVLGVCHYERYKLLSELNDLHQSIIYITEALGQTNPKDSADLRQRNADLGAAHTSRYGRLGNLEDSNKAFQYHSNALKLTPDSDGLKPRIHGDFGIFYHLRFQRLGDSKDLEEAIRQKSLALKLLPNSARQHASLAASYAERFRYLRQSTDLDEAIKLQEKAVKLTRNNANPGRDYPFRLVNLGVYYNDRYRLRANPKDLEDAIGYKSQAVQMTPHGHPDLPRRQISLAASLTDRYQLLKKPEDLTSAIQYDELAIKSTPREHIDLAQWYCSQAETFLLRYRNTRTPSEQKSSLDSALASFKNAFQTAAENPRNKFQLALRWAECAYQVQSQGDPLDSLRASQNAIDHLPQFAWLGATTSQRYKDLLKAENLGAKSAHAAILQRNYGLALEFLEQARCVVWQQMRMLRSPLDKLRSHHPQLADEIEAAGIQLDGVSNDPESLGPAELEQAAQVRRALAQRYKTLLSDAQKSRDFEGFPQPRKLKDLVPAARNGTVVVITCRANGSDALIIQQGANEVKHVPLPTFQEEMAKEARTELGVRLERSNQLPSRDPERRPASLWKPTRDDSNYVRGILKELWECVVYPVLKFLKLQVISTGDKRPLPHIIWCPTGTMSFLPLHAAGDYLKPAKEPGHRIFEYAVSSYTPTLTALLTPPPKPLSRSGILAIGQENTPKMTRLPGTTQELAFVKKRTPTQTTCTQLLGNQATRDRVLQELGKHDWVHFACHAQQKISEPLKSQFFLYDMGLSLADIYRQRFRDKGLAFLSACQTARGDKHLPDEAIHLASGMLIAGYPSVIATMWSVVDEDAPVVADYVYATLMKDGKIGSGEAGRALHYAVAELRKKIGEEEFMRWVPYIHIGL